MELIHWSYMRRHQVRALFDQYPSSPVVLRKIGGYYFVYHVKWAPSDPEVSISDLKKMELLINREFGSEQHYRARHGPE